jgi:hypothetical protein
MAGVTAAIFVTFVIRRRDGMFGIVHTWAVLVRAIVQTKCSVLDILALCAVIGLSPSAADVP